MESSLHHIQPTCCCQVLLACISRGTRQSALLARTPIATTTHHTNILPQAELHHKHKSTINTSSHPLANCSFPTQTSPSIQPHGEVCMHHGNACKSILATRCWLCVMRALEMPQQHALKRSPSTADFNNSYTQDNRKQNTFKTHEDHQ